MERRRADRRLLSRRIGERRVPQRRRPDVTWRRRLLRRRTVLSLIAAILLAPLAWQAFRRGADYPHQAVPPELIGVWVTAAPRYEDRALEFTRASVILHTDDAHFTVHPVRVVQRKEHGPFVTYHIEYQDVEGPTALDFRFVSVPQPLIRLEHLTTVWRRTARR
jgi:hypothetical protein